MENVPAKAESLDWKFIKEKFANGCPDKDFLLLMKQSEARGLNPLAGDVYYVKNWNDKDKKYNWGMRVSIDAMRKRAQASGEVQAIKRTYDESTKQSTVRLWKKGCQIPFEETVEFDEFAVKFWNKEDRKWVLGSMWKKMPGQMLKKCCEATVLRMAFPEKFSGLYIKEEMPEAVHGATGKADTVDVEIKEGTGKTVADYMAEIRNANDPVKIMEIAAEAKKSGLQVDEIEKILDRGHEKIHEIEERSTTLRE